MRSTMACWKRVREIVLRRDWFRCQICGDRPGDPHTKLQVHHILERARGGSHDPGNLVTLCDLCHAVAHEHMGPAMRPRMLRELCAKWVRPAHDGHATVKGAPRRVFQRSRRGSRGARQIHRGHPGGRGFEASVPSESMGAGCRAARPGRFLEAEVGTGPLTCRARMVPSR